MKKIGLILKIFTPMIIILALVMSDTDTRWISLNVSHGVQGDSHLISKNNKHMLIDAGMARLATTILIPKLKKYGVTELEALILSHPHLDHYGGTLSVLQSDIRVKHIYMNMPSKEQMNKEWWGGNYKHLIDIQTEAKKQGIPIHTIKQHDKIKFDDNTYFDVLYAYDGINTPVGKTDINDMSAIMMLHDHGHKFLFTGDLNKKLGGFIAEVSENLHADVLKFPHHGVESYAPDSFFDAVQPKQMIVPTTNSLWISERAKRARTYVKEHNIKTYVNGLHGDIVLISNNDGYTIYPSISTKEELKN